LILILTTTKKNLCGYINERVYPRVLLFLDVLTLLNLLRPLETALNKAFLLLTATHLLLTATHLLLTATHLLLTATHLLLTATHLLLTATDNLTCGIKKI